MKKGVILLIAISMICVNMSGAATSINKPVINDEISNYGMYPINKPTESLKVNEQELKNIDQEVEKYLNFEEYIKGEPTRKTIKEIEYPWHIYQQSAGDFVEWIIQVDFKDKHFQEIIDINPVNFKDRFLEHPWHYEKITFDTNEDGIEDLDVYYSIFISQLTNYPEKIDIKSIRSCLKVRTEDILERTAKLEVYSEIKFNYGLIKGLGKSQDRSILTNTKSSIIVNRFLEKIKTKYNDPKFILFKNFLNQILNRLQNDNAILENPTPVIAAADSDWLALGIGVISPEGEQIPSYFEKYLNVAKDNIFTPIIFEQELKQVGSQEPLGLLFGFQAGKASQNPSTDVAFEINFDPAIHIRTQFIPMSGYIYYYFDTGSAYSQETSVTFTTNGFGIDNVELSLIFDNTLPISQNGNWMSFDVKWLGFDYKANKKHTVSVLLSSPSFSGKLKLNGIPSSISCEFDADLSFTYQQGQLLDVSGTGSLTLTMNSNMGNIILYYPELNAYEPKVEFIEVSSIPSTRELSAYAHLYIQNGSMTKIKGEGYVDLDMSSSLGSIKVFYRKADPNDPDKLFINVPQGIPASQRIGAEAELYMDLDNFSNNDNYVYARGYRTSSGNIQEISAYLPGKNDPIVKITDIPANSEGEGKLEWNKLKGYANAQRWSAGGPDPIELNVDIGTFNIYNFFQLRDGIIGLDVHLAQDGYFDFYTTNDMIANNFKISDTSTGNQVEISADDINADFDAQWNLDLTQQPIQIEELAFNGEISLLENFVIEATYQNKYLNFDMNWAVGESGEIAFNFTQDEPIEIILDDLFPSNPTYDLGGGVIINEDFHFDIKWKWKQGESQEDPGYFKINEDTNDPNFGWIGIFFTYTPSGYTEPQYGVEIGGNNVGLIVFFKWWKDPNKWLPIVWWYVYIMGDFYVDLLWKGDWYENIHTW
jgi:hypothetical protein